MFIKVFIEEKKVVQLAKVGGKDVECEASVPYSDVEFVDARDPSAKNIKVGSNVEQDSNGDYTFTLPVPEQSTTSKYPTISVVQFKMLLYPQERVSLRESTDPMIIDFLDLINDSRVTNVNLNLQSVQDSIEYVVRYLNGQGVVTDVETRKAEILSGKLR